MSKAYFSRTPEGIEDMAAFCAGLTKAGCVYECKLRSDTEYMVTITGF